MKKILRVFVLALPCALMTFGILNEAPAPQPVPGIPQPPAITA